MEQEIQTSKRLVKIKEIKYTDLLNLGGQSQTEIAKKTLLLGSDLTEEEIEQLSARDGLQISKSINRINGFDEKDFQKL